MNSTRRNAVASTGTVRSCRQRAFTLVEILIVVVILGILAAIIIPQFADATADSRRATLVDILQSLRTQVNLYTVQHGDTTPPLAGADWSALTERSVYRGQDCGPYLVSVPVNPLNQYTNIAVVATNPAFGDPVAGVEIGWVYNPNTGIIWATNTTGDRVYNEFNPKDPNN